MKLLPLSNSDQSAIIDDADYISCIEYTWVLGLSGTNGNHNDIKACVGGKSVRLSRFITQDFSSDVVDHKDRNEFNNQRNNLRGCTWAQNARNRKISSKNTTGFKGVSVRKGYGFAAGIRVNNKQIHLGFYKTPQEAAKRYNQAAISHYGEFAFLNEI